MTHLAETSDVAISAILNWMYWLSPIARPNCLRSLTYSAAFSRQAWA